MSKHDANWTTTTFCRKCKKLRSCYNTSTISEYRFLCKPCTSDHITTCKNCGREGLKQLLDMQDGLCGFCLDDSIVECYYCGKEGFAYKLKLSNGMCIDCLSGRNQQCDKCKSYYKVDDLHDGLCEKCRITIFKSKQKRKVDEVVECMECGREQHIKDMKDGVCIFCYKDEELIKLKKDIKKIRKRVYGH